MSEEDTPLTDILLSHGITHRRDERSTDDYAHSLYAADGRFLGRFTAHAAWRHLDQIRQLASSSLPLPPY